ncbi:hypothetical protein [Vibrio europaeus]|uniref:hypothetical protein n=1 Tax=Vibrio europaeus TaxID=300876 RepID=UPI00233F0EF7|nr:hypothetical protein [Vibrio europaeus]MDC5719431.1 hypothetical protein [Vibrio europaeus]MDC5720973.1 hypothetical protein [Vibrio europaeus]
MKFTLIRPNRPDLPAQFKLIKRAFNGVDCAKAEFEFCCEAVINHSASMYHLLSREQGVSLRFVGYVTSDNDYLILAMTGKGLLKGAPAIIDAVKSQGYRTIKYHTVRAGMTRILQGLGFVISGKSEHDSVLSLNLEDC